MVHCYIVVLMVNFALLQGQSWTGQYRVRKVVTYTPRTVCSRHFLLWCTGHSTVYDLHSQDVYACCPAWRETYPGSHQCNTPVCNPPCKNGGVCKPSSTISCQGPNQCVCPAQHPGIDCDKSVCSHIAPCYPGMCIQPDGCDCSKGFRTSSGSKTDYCLRIDYGEEANLQITQMQVRMSYWPRDQQPQTEQYWMMADSTNLKNNSMGFLWTNQRDFNRFETTCSSQFFVLNLPARPQYIGNTTFGVVEGGIDIWLSKLDPNNNAHRFDSIKNTSLSCPHPVNTLSPQQGLYNCNIAEANFDRTLEHGDFLRVTYKTKGGGFRTVLDLNDLSRVYKVQQFSSDYKTLSVEFRFDFHPPVHCQQSASCSTGEAPLLISPDISKVSPLSISWNGWNDTDSGVYFYTLEVFKMTRAFTHDVQITHDDQVNPVTKLQFNVTSLAMPQHYTPPEAGLYSVVLGATDRANNSRYVRRLVLFDPSSDVTIDPDHNLYVSTASSAANYTYQNSLTSGVVVTWEDHFRNTLHEDKDFLGEVPEFPILPENPSKIIENQLDDHEGRRTVDAISNVRGIVNFQLAYKIDSHGGLSWLNNNSGPDSGWNDLRLNTSFTLPTASEGETYTIWVKATDVMGNLKVDRTQVHFDDTPPTLGQFELKLNSPAEDVDFASTIHVTVIDEESGVAFVEWTFRRENGSIVYHEIIQGKTEPKEFCTNEHLGNCECTPSGVCFPHDQSYSFSNCHVMIEKERLDQEVINVTAKVINMAGLIATKSLMISNLTSLNGTHAYYPPQNVQVVEITDSSVTLTWSFPPSCFRRQELWVELGDQKRIVHKEAEQFVLAELQPETSYTVNLLTVYVGGEISDPVLLTFTTTEATVSAVTSGVIAGVTIGLFILLILVLLVVVFVLWRKGFILQQPGRIHKNLRRINSIYSNFTNLRNNNSQHHRETRAASRVPSAAFPNNAYNKDISPGPSDDELYLYGEMTFERPPPWQMNPNSITLVERLTKGKFANIYKARMQKSGNHSPVVAAKMLKPNYSPDDAVLMSAKINFFASQLEDHSNVLHFLGAVIDDKNWGPVMLTELCAGGQMDRWLVSHRGQVQTELIFTLSGFARGVANGMTYLVSKQITHKRLAARNVLLTDQLEVRVAGFGPQQKEADEQKHSRLPAKWTAPEVLMNQPATEKSDVWSYGIVLWEIFSMGQVPYPSIHSKEIGARLKDGYRMEKPEFADDLFHNMMRDCWAQDPSKRPTFNSLRAQLAHLSVNVTSDINYYDMAVVKP